MRGDRLLLPLVVVLVAAPALAGERPLDTLTALLARSDGATDHLVVASALDELRSMKGAAAPAAETLSRLLSHRAKLYAERDKILVVRLRAYIVLTLSEIGFPGSARPALLDTLAHVDERMSAREIGAAARAAGSLGSRGHDLAPYLLDTLSLQLGEEEFSLERYDADFPPEEATTIQLEAVRALGAISTADDREVLHRLRQLAAGSADHALDPRLEREAREAIKRIGRGP